MKIAEENLNNEFIISNTFQKTDKKGFVQNELVIDSNISDMFGLPIGEKITYKKVFLEYFELEFENGGLIKFQPSVIIILNNGTFKMIRDYNSEMFTRVLKPNYNAKMFIHFYFNDGSTTLDSCKIRFRISCDDNSQTVFGNFDPKFYERLDNGTIEYSGSAYSC